jgi:multidrug efflux pump subunit AcrA (membrane-fusion protein)
MKTLFSKFGKKKTIGGIILLVILVAFFALRKGGSQYQFVTVTQGSITEVVSVTGNTTPVQSLNLSFETGGTVEAVYKNAGDSVSAGNTLVSLDTRNLAAQLAQAQAAVDGAQATLQQLQAGPTSQNLQVSQTALASAQQTLANTFTNIPNAVTDAYAKANDAVRNQIAVFYNTPDSSNPQLSFQVSNSQVLNDADSERAQVTQELNAWQTQITGLSNSFGALSTSTLAQALQDTNNHLAVVANMLNTDATAVIDQSGLSTSATITYKTDVTNAVTEVSDAQTDISTISQNIASEQAAVAQAQAQLSVTLAGSTPGAIAAQQAQVEQDQANVQSIQVNIAQASLVSPINGIVTVQNAKVGQIAGAGQVVTSIISGNDFEVDAEVPETDIGKVAIGDVVNMTFDAFSNENFTGKVFYIDPAQTIVSGVVDYEVKVSFDTPDARIKSGLTANLNIDTQTDPNALILPQFAIVQNVSGTFVDVVQNGKESQVPVTIGIIDQNGNAEILSGVTNGEKVINIGLKPQ